MPRPIRKKQGSTFFWGDYENDKELESCSEGAQALWMRLLCCMFRQPTQGVLNRGIETYLNDKYPITKIADMMRGDLLPKAKELIEKGVCSLGKDMPGALPFESIVCRRMYRKWLEENDKSERCRFAANARWKNEGKNKTRKMGSHAGAFENEAEGTADGMREEYRQVFHEDGLVTNPECERATGSMLEIFSSPALSPYIENQPTNLSSLLADSLPVVRAESTTKPGSGSRHSDNRAVTAIGDVLSAILPETSPKPKSIDATKATPGEAITTAMLMELTSDTAFGKPSKRKMIQKIFETKGGREEMNTLILKLKEPIENKAAIAHAEITRILIASCRSVSK